MVSKLIVLSVCIGFVLVLLTVSTLVILWQLDILFTSENDTSPKEVIPAIPTWSPFQEVQVIHERSSVDREIQMNPAADTLTVTDGNKISYYSFDEDTELFEYSQSVVLSDTPIAETTISRDGDFIAAVDVVGNVTMWSGTKHKPFDNMYSFEFGDYSISNIMFGSKNSRLYVRGVDDENRGALFQVENHQIVWKLEHPSPIQGDSFGMSFHVQDNHLIVASPADQSAFVYNIEKDQPVLVRKIESNVERSVFPYQVAWSNDCAILSDPTSAMGSKNMVGSLVVEGATISSVIQNPFPEDISNFGTYIHASGDFLHVSGTRKTRGVGSTWVYKKSGETYVPHTKIDGHTLGASCAFGGITDTSTRFALGQEGAIRIFETRMT